MQVKRGGTLFAAAVVFSVCAVLCLTAADSHNHDNKPVSRALSSAKLSVTTKLFAPSKPGDERHDKSKSKEVLPPSGRKVQYANNSMSFVYLVGAEGSGMNVVA